MRIHDANRTDYQEWHSPRLLSETDVHFPELPGAETDVKLPSGRNGRSWARTTKRAYRGLMRRPPRGTLENRVIG